MRRILFFLKNSLLLIGFFLLGCEDDGLEKVGEVVELYLIETYETKGNYGQINESTVITEATPLLYYDDFISYSSKECTFVISEESKNKIENLGFTTEGIPFAVKVDDELIYTGYFMSNFSSLIYDWLIIAPIFNDSLYSLKLQLGYPGTIFDTEIPDRRNDKQILDVFRCDNKLIE